MCSQLFQEIIKISRSSGYPGHLPHPPSPGQILVVLHGVGGGVGVPGHDRVEPALQEAQHSQDASLGEEHSHPEDARNTLHESTKTGI